MGVSLGTASFNTAAFFFCFRLAAWESTGASSVCSSSELDDDDDVSAESGEVSLFRFNLETACDDFGTTGDIFILQNGLE